MGRDAGSNPRAPTPGSAAHQYSSDAMVNSTLEIGKVNSVLVEPILFLPDPRIVVDSLALLLLVPSFVILFNSIE